MKGLDAKSWVDAGREKGDVFTDDPVTVLPRCGVATARVLEHKHGIETVEQLLAKIDGIKPWKGVGVKTLRGWKEAAAAATGPFPPGSRVDHKEAENPYKSKYGDNWRDVIANVAPARAARARPQEADFDGSD